VKKKSKAGPPKSVRRRTHRTPARDRRVGLRSDVAAVPVTTADLRALRRELERRIRKPGAVAVGKRRTRALRAGGPLRWNPEPEEVQKSVAQLVLTIVEFLRKLMERQAIRRMEQKTVTRKQAEAVGAALMTLEETIREMGRRFGLEPEDLNLDLGPIGKLM
jgi:Gas vesicle protein K